MLKEVQHHHRVEAAWRKWQLAHITHEVLVVNSHPPALCDGRTMAVYTDEESWTRQVTDRRVSAATQVYNSLAAPKSASNVAPREACTKI
jgi:hypothetical protein